MMNFPLFSKISPLFSKNSTAFYILYVYFPPTLTMMHLCITQCTYRTPLITKLPKRLCKVKHGAPAYSQLLHSIREVIQRTKGCSWKVKVRLKEGQKKHISSLPGLVFKTII